MQDINSELRQGQNRGERTWGHSVSRADPGSAQHVARYTVDMGSMNMRVTGGDKCFLGLARAGQGAGAGAHSSDTNPQVVPVQ